jgi:hypothetical protein
VITPLTTRLRRHHRRPRRDGGATPVGKPYGPPILRTLVAEKPQLQKRVLGGLGCRIDRSKTRNCLVTIETIDSELRLVAALRRAARERGGPLPAIDVADALLDERRELTECVPN